MSTGLSSLTFDDEYLNERAKLKMKRPEHFLEGIG